MISVLCTTAALCAYLLLHIAEANAVSTNLTIGNLNTTRIHSTLPTEVRSLNNFTGPIASIQNNKEGKPTWLLTGYWVANIINKTKENFNQTYPARFDAWINMVMLNGSAFHQHIISNFSLTNVTTQGKINMYKGTVTITMKEGPIRNVPVEIRVMPYVMVITLDRTKTNNHFGDTPIYGDGRPIWL